MPRGSHMTTRYGGLNGSFSLQIEEFQKKALEAIGQTFKDVVIQVGETLINLSPVDTGRFKANWHASLDRVEPATFDDYDKEGDETIASLIAAFNDLQPGQTVYIVNNLAYAIPLEYGHSQTQAPAGMVRLTVAQFQKIVREAVEKNRI